MKNTKALVKQFRSDLESETGIKLDFRVHKFLDNQYGATPCFNYDFAEEVISFLYSWAHNFIEENEENYPHFSGWEYNLQMSIEELRTTPLDVVIIDKCKALYLNHVETYRKEGNKVFKYSPENRAYVFDHTSN